MSEFDEYLHPASKAGSEFDAYLKPSKSNSLAYLGPGSSEDVETEVTLAPTADLTNYSEAKTPEQLARDAPTPESAFKSQQLTAAAGEALRHPLRTLADPGKRRQLERGVSNAVSFGLAEKAGNFVDPAFAATATPDAEAAPGYEELGTAAGAFLPNAAADMAARGVGKAVGAGAKAIGKLKTGASARDVARAAEVIGEGAGRKARKGLQGDAEGLKSVLTDEPELLEAVKTREPTDLLSAAKTVERNAGKANKRLYRDADSLSVAGGNNPGIYPDAPISNLDRRIGELQKGDANERAIAKKLKSIRDEFASNYEESAFIPAEKLRQEQSAFQEIGYGKTQDPDVAATIAANREASKAVGDAVVKHVTGMDYKSASEIAKMDPNSVAGQLFRNNERIKIANRIKAAVNSKLGNNPGAPHRLTAVMDKVGNKVHAAGMVASIATGHAKIAAAMHAAKVAVEKAHLMPQYMDDAILALPVKPVNDTVEKYARRLIGMGVKTEAIVKAVEKLNDESPTD